MALISCSECSKQVSDKAQTCPNCGCPINSQPLQTLTVAVEKQNLRNTTRCPFCNTQISIHAIVCSGCFATKGYNLGNLGVRGRGFFIGFSVFCGFLLCGMFSVLLLEKGFSAIYLLILFVPGVVFFWQLAAGPKWYRRM